MRLRKITFIQLTCSLVAVSYAPSLMAQVEKDDSLKSIQLKDAVVDAQLQKTNATESTYFPTSKQKNAAQSGIDLLNRMGIPQLAIGTGTTINTISNQPVDVFIDWLPATKDDLINMRLTDVKKVVYYDYPSDPRFLGRTHVVNFIMKKYEYGGYIKSSGSERFIANDGQLNLFGKFQWRRMTFDLGLGTSYNNSSHEYIECSETYRLPQEDGSIRTYKRTESVADADYKNKVFWPTLRTVYNNDKITISNVFGASFDHTPNNNLSGNLGGFPDATTQTAFYRNSSTHENSLSYSGNWNFILGKGNNLNFNPSYSYSHSKQSSLYKEGTAEYPNSATDDSQTGRAILQFSHTFNKQSRLNAFCQGLFYHSSTAYSGTANIHDRLTTYRLGPGLSYSLSLHKYYIYLGVGFNYDHSKYGQTVEHSTQPWADASFQLSFNNKNRISVFFHYMTSIPLSYYRSEAVVQSNSLLSYTGNPALEPYKSFDYGITYTCLPSNKFSFSVFAYAWSVHDRYAFVYKPTSTGILRTIEQPMGGFTSMTAGAHGRVNLLQNKLQISGQIAVPYCHNGRPFNTDKTHVNFSLQAYWYFGAWNIAAMYFSNWHEPGNEVNGLWKKSKEIYYASIGWGNSTWKVSAQIANPFSWHWMRANNDMTSKFFDRRQTVHGTDSHCYVKLGITYVIGFGKKVKQGDDASRQRGAGSAILE
ncbi:MAG: hypothetical protein ACOYJG_02755 [Prevotella sp.]|jgi:hypothetical protein